MEQHFFCLQCNSGEWRGGAGAATSGGFASRSRDCGCKGVDAPTMFPEPTMDRSLTIEKAAHSCDPSYVRSTQEHKLVWWAGRVTFPQGTYLGAGSHLGFWWSWCRRLRERTLVASFISVMLKHKFAIRGQQGWIKLKGWWLGYRARLVAEHSFIMLGWE